MNISTVSTYGWDLVIANKIAVVNAALPQVAPQTVHEQIVHSGVSVTMDATLGGWQVDIGGSGALVNMSVACSSLELSNDQKDVKFHGGTFQIQCGLQFEARSGGTTHELVIGTGPGAITVLGATFDGTDFASFAAYAVAGLQQWIDRQTTLPVVLASVADATDAASPVASALAPAELSYAYSDIGTSEGVLAVLATVTGGSSSTGRLQEVSPDAVATDDSVLLVNSTVMASLFGGATGGVTIGSATFTAASELVTAALRTNGASGTTEESSR